MDDPRDPPHDSDVDEHEMHAWTKARIFNTLFELNLMLKIMADSGHPIVIDTVDTVVEDLSLGTVSYTRVIAPELDGP